MTMFGHRNGFGWFRAYTGVPVGYRNPPGGLLGLMGPSGEEEGWSGQAARPLPLFQFGPSLRGARSLPSLFPLNPNKAHILPSEFP